MGELLLDYGVLLVFSAFLLITLINKYLLYFPKKARYSSRLISSYTRVLLYKRYQQDVTKYLTTLHIESEK
jgi:hypothetical protein